MSNTNQFKAGDRVIYNGTAGTVIGPYPFAPVPSFLVLFDGKAEPNAVFAKQIKSK